MLVLLFLLSLVYSTYGSSTYDLQKANASVYLSGAAYCGKDQYKSMVLAGPATGFVYEDTLYDIKSDLQGFIGYLPSTKSIYVSLRGSSSALNWLDDAEVKLVDYTTFPNCVNCRVHYGFYNSIQGIINKTITTVNLLQKRFPLYTVIMTGHSYGASTVQLLAMELAKANITTEIYNFGQPRVGEAHYADFVNSVISTNWRFTHNRDMVPHLPPMDFGYVHSCREVFENESGELRMCSAINGEDASCADQYPLYKTNTDDHLFYLGHRVDCDSSTTLNIFY